MLNSNLKLTLCRTCLVSFWQTKPYNIFNTLDLAEKLVICSGLPVDTSDEYPENVCIKCYEQIVMFYEFQQMCRNSMKKFRQILKSNETLKEESPKDNVESNNQGEDPLNVDNKTSSPFKEKSIEAAVNIRSANKFSAKKIEYRRTKKNIRKKEGGSYFKLDNRNDFQEYLQFDKESAANLEKDNSTPEKKSLSQHFVTNLTENESDLSKELEIGMKELNEKYFTEAESSCSTQECTTQTESHQCDCCSKRFKSLLRLNAHRRQHDGLPPYVCTFEGCECSFDSRYFYSKHKREHNLTRDEIFKCDVDNCERVYKNKSNLNIHKRKFHNLGPQLKTHMCEICGKVFKSSAVLNDHQYTHIDKAQLPFACEEEGCSKRFSNKEKLKIHKMRHAGIKNFTCPYCGMRKTTRNELKIHINYHTLERTYPCRFCPKVCHSAGNLKMHVKNMHERAKDFACSYCERTFAKADTKKYHEMTHTGEKPHECIECGRRFLQPAALRTHRKIHLRQKAQLTNNQNSKESIVVEILVENTTEKNLITQSMET